MTSLSRLVLLAICLISPQILFAADNQPLRFGILSIAQPSRIYTKWQPFADYMSDKLGRPVELVVPRGFGKMKKIIASGGVDFFYINSHVFYRLKQEGKAIGVAQMQNISGNTTSRSEVFVQRGSGIDDIGDLKGKKVAYVSPMGAGGYLAPRAFLNNSGLDGETDIKEVFTKNLSNSIHGVLLGDYDAATMCGVNYRLMSKKIDTGELKVIAMSDTYPENVVGARSDLSPEVIDSFRQILLDLPDSEDGRGLLDKMRSMKIQKFVKYDPALEELTRELLRESHL